MNKQSTGEIGENLACEFLKKSGYRVLFRNYRKPWGEIDIVAKAKDGTLVFVEVKTFKSGGSLSPEDNVTSAKLRKLRRTCEMFAGANPELINEASGWRIDVVAVEIPENGEPVIRHYEGV